MLRVNGTVLTENPSPPTFPSSTNQCTGIEDTEEDSIANGTHPRYISRLGSRSDPVTAMRIRWSEPTGYREQIHQLHGYQIWRREIRDGLSRADSITNAQRVGSVAAPSWRIPDHLRSKYHRFTDTIEAGERNKRYAYHVQTVYWNGTAQRCSPAWIENQEAPAHTWPLLDSPVLTTGAIGDHVVNLRWTKVNRSRYPSPRGYWIYVWDFSSGPDNHGFRVVRKVSGQLTRATMTGLPSGTKLGFFVKQIVNDDRPEFPASNRVFVTTTGMPESGAMAEPFPGRPQDFRTTPGDRAVTLSWTPLEYEGEITDWQVRYGVVNEPNVEWGDWTPIPGATADTASHTVRGLTNDTLYSFQVRAMDGEIPGSPSPMVDATPQATDTPQEAESPDPDPLTGFVLVNASTDADLGAVADSATVEVSAAGSYGIRAETEEDSSVGSVVLTLNGPDGTTHTQTENWAPYSLYGDANGAEHGRALPAGSYTLSATAYAERGGTGDVLGTQSVSFTVTQKPVLTGFVLVNAATQATVATLTEGAEVDFGTTTDGTYGITATVDQDATVGSVALSLSGAKSVSRTENLAPYSLYGDDMNGTLYGETLPAGSYTLSATASAEKRGGGATLGTQSVSFQILGPPVLSIEDDRAEEGTDPSLDFVVTLSRRAKDTVRVTYATADDTATAGADYQATSGTLTFAPGETTKTIIVSVLDDAHDEDEETMTVTLSEAAGATLAEDATTATGTIANSDPLQRAWLARFGRTVATHVTDAVGERLRATGGQDSHLTIGGTRLPLGKQAADKDDGGPTLLEGLAGLLGLGPGSALSGRGGAMSDAPWLDGPGLDPRLGQSQNLTFNLRQVLLGSSFRLNLNAADAGAGAPQLTAWGRFTGTTFDGQDGNLSLDGDVFTGTVGVDSIWGRLLAGVAVAHSRGDGSFRDANPSMEDRGRGGLEQTMTSLHPYLRYAVTDRLDVWGLVGYGWGELDVETETGQTVETDTTLMMGSFGGRGILLEAPETGGFQVATRTDAMLTRTSSDAAANSAATDADAHRLRVILEGSRAVTWTDGRRLTPTMELGLRHDWGDAETGFGMEVGGRVQYADPRLGLTVEGAVRALLAHEDSDYEEWGASGTVRLAPGAGGQGLALTVSPTWGAASSGVADLWSRQTTAGLAPQGRTQMPAGRLTAEVGYGFTAFDMGLLMPYAGTGLAEGADRTYRVGTRLQMTGRWATGLTLNLEGTRQEPAGPQPVNQGLRLQVEWGF